MKKKKEKNKKDTKHTKVLELVLKGKWFKMIASEEKKE